MTLDEAKAVARIVETAEGGCGGCVNEAVLELNKVFPAFNWTIKGIDGFDPAIEVTLRLPATKPAFEYIRRHC
jgi:hypothetical protein